MENRFEFSRDRKSVVNFQAGFFIAKEVYKVYN